MDTHPLVKSLKMYPFPNRASEMQGSGSKPAQAAHSEPARDPNRPCVASLGAGGILGPESLCKRSVKTSKPQDGWGWRRDTHHKSKASETGVKNCKDLFH